MIDDHFVNTESSHRAIRARSGQAAPLVRWALGTHCAWFSHGSLLSGMCLWQEGEVESEPDLALS